MEGAAELGRTLRVAAGELRDLSSADDRAGAVIAAAARARAPRRTGRLAASVQFGAVAGAMAVGAGGPSVPYAGVIHNGWPGHNITAQPFISDAARDTGPAWLAAYTDAVSDAVDSIRGA